MLGCPSATGDENWGPWSHRILPPYILITAAGACILMTLISGPVCSAQCAVLWTTHWHAIDSQWSAKMAGAWFLHWTVWPMRPVRGLYRPALSNKSKFLSVACRTILSTNELPCCNLNCSLGSMVKTGPAQKVIDNSLNSNCNSSNCPC